MNLELTNREREKLLTVLEHFIPELRGEIASGVKHDWKIEMKKERDILTDILGKLKNLN